MGTLPAREGSRTVRDRAAMGTVGGTTGFSASVSPAGRYVSAMRGQG